MKAPRQVDGIAVPRRGLRVRGALIALTALIWLVPLASAGSVSKRSYEGALSSDSAAPIEATVVMRGGEPRRATFQVQSFPFICEGDDSPRQKDSPVIEAAFNGGRVFEGRLYGPPGASNEAGEMFKVQGKMLSDGRLKGFFFWFFDPEDYPENFPECSTDGLLRWTAERVLR